MARLMGDLLEIVGAYTDASSIVDDMIDQMMLVLLHIVQELVRGGSAPKRKPGPV